jgi:hypothetical protein
LTPANEISLTDPYEGTLRKCCIDRLRRQALSECGSKQVRAKKPVSEKPTQYKRAPLKE